MNKDVSKVIINGPSVLLRAKEEDDATTKGGIVLPGQKNKTYLTAEVVKIGTGLSGNQEVIEGFLKEGSLVMYNRARVTDVLLYDNGELKPFLMAEQYESAIKIILDVI